MSTIFLLTQAIAFVFPIFVLEDGKMEESRCHVTVTEGTVSQKLEMKEIEIYIWDLKKYVEMVEKEGKDRKGSKLIYKTLNAKTRKIETTPEQEVETALKKIKKT